MHKSKLNRITESGVSMKKKLLVISTAICLALTTVAAPLNMVSAATDTTKAVTTATETKSEPEIGDVVSGFELTKVGYDTANKAWQYLFVHKKTGATMLVIQNSDTNRGFSISFNTPADNDKGANHIIEHSVLGGSKKYPSSNIIFDLTNTTYVSFVNAFTYQNMTMYPICSASEQQLLKSADIYLDAVYNPLLLSDQRIFEREGWRYELKSQSSDLTYNGIVYNEMQGNMGSIETASYYNAQKAIFPDSNQGYNSGGDPKQITKLTYKEVLSTYKKNYHPSNSFMVLYGDVDYEAFLTMIDKNYLSSYSKKNYAEERDTQKSFSKLLQKTYTFPVAKGEATVNKAVIDLVFAASDVKKLGEENYVALSTAVALLNLDNSALKQAMQKSGIAESYRISLGSDTFQPTIHFIATNADPSKKMDFYNLVLTELKKVVKNGLDSELVKASLRSIEFDKALGNDSNSAVESLASMSLYNNIMNDPLYDYNYYYKIVVAQLDDKILEKVIQKQIVSNKTAALTVTVPKAGLLESNAQAKAKELTKEKSSMNSKQLKAMVQKTTDFSTWNTQSTSAEVLKSLQAVTLKELTADVRDRNVKEREVGGVKLKTADANVDSVSSIYLTFDVSHLTAEELLYLKFYSDMLTNGMATATRTENQVQNDTALKAYGISTSLGVFANDKNDSSAHPVLGVNYYGFEDEYADTFALVSDLLLQSKISDISVYGSRTISNLKAQYQGMFAEPLNLALYRSLSYTSPSYRYYNYFYGLDYYNFVIRLEKQLQSAPKELVQKLEAVRTKALNRSNLTVLFAGEAEAQNKFAAELSAFTSKLSNESYPKVTLSLPKPAAKEAWIINSTVQYLCVNGALRANEVPISGKADAIAGILNNMMLTPEIRLKGGAYGVGAYFSANNYYAYTYRDTNYVTSLTTLGATDEFLKSVIPYVTPEVLENYKLSAYATATQSKGEINEALSSLLSRCQGVTTQDKLDALTDLKNVSVTDLQDYAGYLEKINSNLNYVVVAPKSEIEKNKDLFDTVITLP
ncbi:MAG: peptidase domain protein [Herbinix sp.]|nr:peptidase domain protein [Herbinix sp.]